MFISSQNENIYTKIKYNDKFFTSHIKNFKSTYDCIYKSLNGDYELELLEDECSLTDIRISEYPDFESLFEIVNTNTNTNTNTKKQHI